MRALTKVPGLVKDVTYRPSVRTQFEYRLKNLSEAERQALKRIAKEQDLEVLADGFTPESKARVLDAASDYMEFKNPQDLLKEGGISAKWKQKLLVTRAQLGIRSQELKVPPPVNEMPHLGHDIRRFTFEGGTENGLRHEQGGFTRFGMRFAMNDMLDPGLGYPRNSQIEFMNVNLRYRFQRKEIELENVTLFRVESISPYTTYKNEFSFNVELGMKRIMDRNCDYCMAGTFEAGPGLAFQPGDNPLITIYSYLDFQIAYASAFQASNLRVGSGPTLGAVFLFNDDLRAMIAAKYKYSVFSREPHAYEAKSELRYGLNRSVALNVRAAKQMDSWETAGSIMLYW
jgi:hypothetical protein